MSTTPSPSTPRRTLAVFINALTSIILLPFMALRLLRRSTRMEDNPALLETSEMPSSPDEAQNEQPNRSWINPWLLLPLFAIGAVITLVLPSAAAALVLLLVMSAALIVVARDSDFPVQHTPGWLYRFSAGTHRQARVGRSIDAEQVGLRWLTTAFTGVAVVCMVLSAHEFRPMANMPNRTTAVLLMLGGGVALGLALLTNRLRGSTLIVTDAPITPSHSRGLQVLTGVLLLALVMAINTKLLGVPLLNSVSTHIQFLLWLGGIGLVAWGLSGVERLRLPRLERGEAITLLIIATVAFGVRLYHLETAVRASIDEAHFLDGLRFLQDNSNLPLLVPQSNFLPVTMMPLYLNHVVIGLLGERSFFSLRFTQVLFGTLDVLAVYGLCRALFNSRRMAVAAALVTIGFPLHVHFSRIGMAHMMDTLFGTLALMFIARGLQANRRADWVLGGVSLGLTQYFFEGGRLLFPPVVMGWTIWLVITQRQRLRQHGRGFLLVGIAALFTATPVYYSVYALDAPRASRYSDSGLGGEYFSTLLEDGINQAETDELLRLVTDPFLYFVSRAELIPQFFGGNQPLVITVFVPLFLLGLFYVIWRWREPSFVIVIWIVGTVLGNSLLADPFQAPRYVEVTPALALCIAVGIGVALPMLLNVFRPSERTLSRLTMAAAAGVSVVLVVYYFGPHLRLFNEQFREDKGHGDGVDAMLRVIENYPRDTQILVISEPELDGNIPRRVLGFMLGTTYPFETKPSGSVDAAFFEALPGGTPYAFFVDPADVGTMVLIQQYFEVEPPQYSLNVDVPASREYVLLYAPAKRASG